MSSLKVEVDPTSFGFSFERLERIGEHFNRYVDDRRLPGWLATISRGGELVWSDKGGYRDRERGLSVEDDTIWRIYSMTKPITAVAVMMLYEEVDSISTTKLASGLKNCASLACGRVARRLRLRPWRRANRCACTIS